MSASASNSDAVVRLAPAASTSADHATPAQPMQPHAQAPRPSATAAAPSAARTSQQTAQTQASTSAAGTPSGTVRKPAASGTDASTPNANQRTTSGVPAAAKPKVASAKAAAPGSKKAGSSKPGSKAAAKPVPKAGLPIGLIAGASGVVVAGALLLWALLRRGKAKSSCTGNGANGEVTGPCSRLKPSAKAVALADGSACVVKRPIPADNSCLFNAIAYCMHGSKQKAAFLRGVVAREVSSDPETYSTAFLGMSNVAYCNWIMNPTNWGGGIELAILARHYGREISAWNMESCKQHVFGEDAGYGKRVMVIYNGVHYDALGIAKKPNAPESEDKTEFNPRTKSGKLAVAAAQKLVELAHRGSKFYKKPGKAAGGAVSGGAKLKCGDCGVQVVGQAGAAEHAKATGHAKFQQVA